MSTRKIWLNINGANRMLICNPEKDSLADVLRRIGLTGTKIGCNCGQCGACTVLLDGAAIRSCVMPLAAAAGHKITTLEGLGSMARPHPLQQAFIDEQAVQCGYCINGMIMSAKALLDRNPKPSRDDIKQALNGNLCRCGTHMRIVRAIERVAKGGQG